MEHFSQLRTAWDRFGDDDDAWVAVITGVGHDFCVGADLKTYIPQITELQQEDDAGEAPRSAATASTTASKAVLRGVKLYKPIVAAVNGTCVAGGMEMLGGCDLRVAVGHRHLRGHGAQAGTVRRRRHDGPAPPPDPLPRGHGVASVRRPGSGAPGLRDGSAQRGARRRIS